MKAFIDVYKRQDYTQHLLDNVKKIHFIGCGGSGMYPLIPVSYTHLYGAHLRLKLLTERHGKAGQRV